MVRLIIIGNGFDLSHGFKTKYSDFLEWYYKRALRELNETRIFKDCLLEISFQQGVNGIPVSDKTDIKYYLDLPKERRGFNINPISELMKSMINDRKWVDFEYEFFVVISSHILDNSLSSYRAEKVKKINKDLVYIKELLIKYLGSIDLYFNPTPEYIEKFAKQINHYEIIEIPYRANYENNIDKILFLNFNYTNLIETYIPGIYEINPGIKFINTINIHGSLNDEQSNIIFGYGDEYCKEYKILENHPEKELLQNFKSFGYFLNDSYQTLLRTIESENFEVFVVGHSLGISDRTLLKQIFEHKNCISIKLFQKDKDDYTNKTYNAASHFDDKILMRERIQPYNKLNDMPQVAQKKLMKN